MSEWQAVWDKFSSSMSSESGPSVQMLTTCMILSGALSWYIRFLYQRCATTATDTDSLSRTFPLLAIVTTGLIAVLKSSLALSLGLVGALSIVRFRAAIKDPEELVYLFLCIAIGLSLGAEQPHLAITLVAVATVYIVAMSFTGRKSTSRLLLTVTGDAQQFFAGDSNLAMAAIESTVGRYTLQRLDIDGDQGQVRVSLPASDSKETTEYVTVLRQKLPECDVSFVNLNSRL